MDGNNEDKAGGCCQNYLPKVERETAKTTRGGGEREGEAYRHDAEKG